MLNTTSLCHPTLVKKIFDITKNIIKNDWCVDHVCNAKGVPILAIRVRNGKAKITDRHNRDLTNAFSVHLGVIAK